MRVAAFVFTYYLGSFVAALAEPSASSAIPFPTPTPVPKYVTNISLLKDLANIGFFVATGIIAILTYGQAKRTIFTPFKTEAFKLQLKAFEEVLVFFEKHPTTNIDDEFDFDGVVRLNARRLLHSYAMRFFHDEIDHDKFQKAKEELDKQRWGALISEQFMEMYLDHPTHLKPEKRGPTSDVPASAAIVLAQWQEYKHGMIELTKRSHTASERVRRFRASPLLPAELKELIRAFEKAVSSNLQLVGEVMTAVAKELPQKFPTLESLNKANLAWIWNQYNHKRQHLGDAQNAILAFVGGYLQIDALLARKS